MPAFRGLASVDLRPTKTMQLPGHYVESTPYAKYVDGLAGFAYARFWFPYTNLSPPCLIGELRLASPAAPPNHYFHCTFQPAAGFDMMDGVRRWQGPVWFAYRPPLLLVKLGPSSASDLLRSLR